MALQIPIASSTWLFPSVESSIHVTICGQTDCRFFHAKQETTTSKHTHTHTHTHTHKRGVMAKNMTTSKLCFDMIEEMDLMEKQHQ